MSVNATVLFRTSPVSVLPVVCAVFNNSNPVTRKIQIEIWKGAFMQEFPEFDSSSFNEVEVDLIP